jgi:hypothetical protein
MKYFFYSFFSVVLIPNRQRREIHVDLPATRKSPLCALRKM